MGSIYLLLATNLGGRLGFLVALTGLFGWMIIHSMIWWIYPPAPGPVRAASRRGTSPRSCTATCRSRSSPRPTTSTSSSLPIGRRGQQDDAGAGRPAQRRPGRRAQRVAPARRLQRQQGRGPDRGRRRAGRPATSPALEDSTSRVFTYTFETGGKPKRQGDTIWDKISNRVTNTLRIKNPPHYAIVQVQPSIKQETVAGQPPPPPDGRPRRPGDLGGARAGHRPAPRARPR